MLPQHQHSAPFDSQVVDSWHTFPLLNTVLLYDDFLQQQTYIIYLTKIGKIQDEIKLNIWWLTYNFDTLVKT